jgi:hypothetical protein
VGRVAATHQRKRRGSSSARASRQLDVAGVAAARQRGATTARQLDDVRCCSSTPVPDRAPLDGFAFANYHGLLEASTLEGDAKHCYARQTGICIREI